jgi:hypothetical protein
MIEVNDLQRDSQSLMTAKSSDDWLELWNKLVAAFNVYPDSIYAQYHLSTDAKGTLPLDLISENHFGTLVKLLRPLVVPLLLANGHQLTQKMKALTVQVFNRNSRGVESGQGCGKKSSGKVSAYYQ